MKNYFKNSNMSIQRLYNIIETILKEYLEHKYKLQLLDLVAEKTCCGFLVKNASFSIYLNYDEDIPTNLENFINNVIAEKDYYDDDDFIADFTEMYKQEIYSDLNKYIGNIQLYFTALYSECTLETFRKIMSINCTTYVYENKVCTKYGFINLCKEKNSIRNATEKDYEELM